MFELVLSVVAVELAVVVFIFVFEAVEVFTLVLELVALEVELLVFVAVEVLTLVLDFVCIACDDFLSEEEQSRGSVNDGYEYDAETALQIADRLKEALEVGFVQKFAEERQARLDSLPLETCNLCNGTGVRDDEYVQGKCNGCDGTGKVKNWNTNYPFDVDNVKEFEQFCRLSGGFEIC